MKAFTLIELLVVISIIGLLASIVLVSLEGGEERAVTGKAMEFSHTVRVSLGADLVGEWTFDDGTGKDSSGNNNNSTVNGASSTDGIIGGRKALQFNGSSDYVVVASSSILNEVALGYTVEVWVKPQLNNEFWTGVVGKPGRNYNFWLGSSDNSSGGYVHHRFHTTVDVNDSCPEAYTIEMNKWSYVVLTNNGSTCRTFINAEKKAERTFSATLIADSSPLYIGRSPDGGSGNYFQGIIDEVRIYNRALSMSEIQEHYAAGAAKHSLTLK